MSLAIGQKPTLFTSVFVAHVYNVILDWHPWEVNSDLNQGWLQNGDKGGSCTLMVHQVANRSCQYQYQWMATTITSIYLVLLSGNCQTCPYME